jgi:hypothetical protein
MTPEKLGEMVAVTVIATPDFRAKVDKLASELLDSHIYDVARELLEEVEKSSGIQFEDEEQHFEFGMTFEGDVHRAICARLAKILEA